MSIEDQMHLIGRFMGWMIVAGYLWSVMNYFVKIVYKKKVSTMPTDSSFRRRYTKFMQTVIKSHVYVPLFVITIMLLHLLLELIHVGFFITGVIVFVLMFTQILLGLYGAYVKYRKKGPWFYAHRVVAGLLFIALVVHVITVILINP